MDKKILIIQTGGTVCSTAKNTQIHLSDSADKDLLHIYRNAYGYADEFTVISPFYMLSEDSTPAHIGQLLSAVKQAVTQPWDGIIILHGTDTLPYSAAAVGLCFGNCGKCIVFSSANITPDQPGSNALPNFRSAVLLIQNQIPGVFCTYRNTDDKDYVFLSTRLNMADAYSDDFTDYFHQPFATLQGDKIIKNEKCNMLVQSAVMPYLDYTFSKDVLFLTPYPGLRYNMVDPRDYAAVLHSVYHSGTACTQKGYALPDFVKRCSEQNIPLYIAPLKRLDKYYRTTQEILASGAKVLHQISPVTAYIKLLLAYNQNQTSPEEFLSKIYYFETVEEECTH